MPRTSKFGAFLFIFEDFRAPFDFTYNLSLVGSRQIQKNTTHELLYMRDAQ